MLGYKSNSRFYPEPTGDPGRDRNARTVQFASLLLAAAVSLIATLNVIAHEPKEMPFLAFAVAGLVAAMVINRASHPPESGSVSNSNCGAAKSPTEISRTETAGSSAWIRVTLHVGYYGLGWSVYSNVIGRRRGGGI